MKHTFEMIGKGLVLGDDDKPLDEDSQEVNDYKALEIVKLTQFDDKLFEYLYDNLCTIGDDDSNLPEGDRWK